MEALSSTSLFLPAFQETFPKPAPSLRIINLSAPKTTLLAAVAREVSGDAEDDQQLHLHNAFDFAPQQPSSSTSSVQYMLKILWLCYLTVSIWYLLEAVADSRIVFLKLFGLLT